MDSKKKMAKRWILVLVLVLVSVLVLVEAIVVAGADIPDCTKLQVGQYYCDDINEDSVCFHNNTMIRMISLFSLFS